MSIATPLLYYVVVLKSKAQACALERIFRKRKEHGTHIKKLRVEGEYGAVMHTIIVSAPNTTHLCLSLGIRSSDNISGLCSAPSFKNPSCLVIPTPPDTLANATLKRLVAILG
jgi:hypothetical protein